MFISFECLKLFLKALQVGLFTSERSIIITNLDAQTIDLTPFQYTEAQIYMFRIVQPDEPHKEIKEINDLLESLTTSDNYTPEEVEGN